MLLFLPDYRTLLTFSCWAVLCCSLHLTGLPQELPPVVITRVVEAQANTAYRVVGTVKPLRDTTIGSAVAGRVGEFLINDGDAVEAGQPLARLQTLALEIELQAAEAELELFQQELAELQNGSRPEEILEAEANADAAEAAMEIAADQLTRLENLITSGAATDSDLDLARDRANTTRFAFKAAQATLQRVSLGPRVEQIAQAQARVEMQRQRKRLIEDRIEKHTIRSPFSGFVAAEHTEVGAWVAAGDPIAQVIQLDQVEVQAAVTDQQAVAIEVGSTVRIEFPAIPDKLLTGTIARIVPHADSRSRTFPVLIGLENEIRRGTPLLMSGMLAQVDLPAGVRRVLPLVPKDALVLNADDRAVFVVDLSETDSGSDRLTGIVRKVPVELGVAVDTMIQVRGQLKAGEFIVVVGNERLIPGMQVSVAEILESSAGS